MILTARGDYFRFDGPYWFDIEVIAASLSKLCRFNGHCRDFYSVAQHSVHASEIVSAEFALEALLHDAQEAYLGDITAPLKRRLIDYQAYETRVECGVREWFNLPPYKSPEVLHADLVMLATERRDFMPVAKVSSHAWGVLDGIEPRPDVLTAWPWEKAEGAFLKRYAQLIAEQDACETGQKCSQN